MTKIPISTKFLLQDKGSKIAQRIIIAQKGRNEPNDLDQQNPPVLSLLGNPVYSSLNFDAKIYKVKEEEIDFPGIRIDAVLMTVNQTKNIVKTPVQGRNGTVKEYISDGDFSISVSGSISSDSLGVYPADKVDNLIKVLNIADAIDVTSEFLFHFGISSVVVDSYSFPQESGVRNVQKFNISLTSDVPLEIKIKEDEIIYLESESSKTIFETIFVDQDGNEI